MYLNQAESDFTMGSVAIEVVYICSKCHIVAIEKDDSFHQITSKRLFWMVFAA